MNSLKIVRSTTRFALLLAALTCSMVAGVSTASAASLNVAANCSLSSREQKTLGATYVTSLRVSGVSCAKGKSVVRSFNRCRKKNGKRGKCNSRIQGFRCTESRNSIPTQFTSATSCKRGSKVVSFNYEQFT